MVIILEDFSQSVAMNVESTAPLATDFLSLTLEIDLAMVDVV